MKKLLSNIMAWALVAGVLAVAGQVSVVAQTSGGFPSRPTFQKVIVKGPLSATTLTASGAIGGSAITGTSVTATVGGAAATVFSVADTSHEAIYDADIPGVEDVCVSLNQSAAPGDCGMPSGDRGIGTRVGTLFLHAGNGGIATDATSTPWPNTGALITESATTCTVTRNRANVASCARTGVGAITVTFTSALGASAICVEQFAAVPGTGAAPIVANTSSGTTTWGLSVSTSNGTLATAADVWSLDMLCM